MERILVIVWPATLSFVMVFLPSLGPLIDHHYAERQPYHAHVVADAGHKHAYGDVHAHTDEGGGETYPALPNLQVSAASAIAIPSDADLMNRVGAGPGATSPLPAAALWAPRSIDTSPPHGPPKSVAPVSVTL